MAIMDQGAQDLAGLALSIAAKRALELGFDKLTTVLTKVRASLSAPQYEIEKALSDHQKESSPGPTKYPLVTRRLVVGSPMSSCH